MDDTDSEDEDEVSDSDDDDGGNDDPAVDFEYVMTDGVTSYKAETDAVILPDHLRCCSHTLNLIATTDAESALQSASYKKLYRQSTAKTSAIWNLTSRSTKAADAAFQIVGNRFLVPCVTRWNSYYDAIKKIVSCDERKLTDVCKALELPPLIHTEVAFLEEYVSVMAPVAAALDILQGEQQCSLGYVLPTLTSLKTKLRNMDLQSTGPLRDSVLRGINTRFGHCFQDKEFIMAAVTHPRFKLSWLDDADARARCTQQLETANYEHQPQQLVQATQATQQATTSNTADENGRESVDNFFDFGDQTAGQSQRSYDYDDNLFRNRLYNEHHALKQLLPDVTNHQYHLRQRRHNHCLTVKTDDRNFVTRQLFKDLY